MTATVRTQTVSAVYTNHGGKTAQRRFLPIRIYFGATEWHTNPQWLMEAFDIDKQALRTFAMADISEWSAQQ